MAIVDQSYQPWSGDLQPRRRRIGAMVRVGIRQAYAGLMAKILLLSTYLMVFGTIGILFIASTFQQSVAIVSGNNIYRFYLGSIFPTGILIMTLAALVGGRSIANDLRFNAVSMYFSKAITRTDYLVGKWATVSAFLLSGTLVPALLLWICQWAISREEISAGSRAMDLLALTGHSLVIVLPIAMYALALSSLSRNAFVPGILWVMTFFGSIIVSGILTERVEEDWCKLVSWHNLATRLGEALYEKRVVKVQALGSNLMPIEGTMPYPWYVPAAILGGITLVSALFVLWRMRKFEGQE